MREDIRVLLKESSSFRAESCQFVTMAENYAQQVSKVMNTWTEAGFDISVIQWSLPSLNIQLN